MSFGPDNYARKTGGRGDYWKRRTVEKAGNYCKGIARKLGISEAECQASKAGQDYLTGIQAASPADYNQGVAAAAQDWFQNYRAAFTR